MTTSMPDPNFVCSVNLRLFCILITCVYPGNASYSLANPTRLPDLLFENLAKKDVLSPATSRVTSKPFPSIYSQRTLQA